MSRPDVSSRRLSASALALGAMLVVAGCTSVPTHAPRATGVAHSQSSRLAARPAGGAATDSRGPLVDGGKRPGAEGTVIRDKAGDPSTYIVANDDTLLDIATRFGISLEDLIDRTEKYSGLQPGESLNLLG